MGVLTGTKNNSGGGSITGKNAKGGSVFGDVDYHIKNAQIASEQAALQPKKVSKPAPKPVEQPKKSLLGKATSIAKTVGKVAKDFASAATVGEKQFMTPVARHLPGGTADLKANEEQAASAVKNTKFIKDQQKAGKISKPAATKLLNVQAKNASETSKAQTKTLKELPSKKQAALGAASTAADILSGGTYGAAVKGAQAGKVIKGAQMAENTAKAKKATALLSKGGKVKEYAKGAGGIAATNGSAGGLNAAAGGGDKKSVELNAALGFMLPSALHVGATTLANGGAKTAEKLSASQSKLLKPLKAVSDTATGDAKQGTKDIQNYQRTALLNEASKAEPNKVIATKVDPELVKQGVITGEVKQTPVHEITIGAEHAGKKVDNAKVKQYEKQIKDGEPIEPVVTHEVNGKTVVVDGQHRLAAMQNLGVKEIPTVEKAPGAMPSVAAPIADVKPATPVPVAKPEAKLPGAAEPTTVQTAKPVGELKVSSDPIIASKTVDSAPIKQQIEAIKNSEKSYGTDGNLTPEAGKQINTLNKQLNTTGERAPKAEKPVTVTPIKETTATTPEIKTSKLGLGVEANAIKRGLTEGFADKPEYAKVNKAQQAKAAAELLKSDPDRLVRIAMGHERPPEGLLPESAYIAAENYAYKTGNAQLAMQLATKSHLVSEATGMGQRISMLAEREGVSPGKSIKRISDIGNKTFEKRTGKKFDAVVKQNTKEVKAAIPPVKAKDWSSFVDSLKC